MGEDRFAETHRSGRRATYGCMVTFFVWCACLILMSMGRKWLSLETPPWPWLSFVVSILVIFICPVIGILQAIDLKDYFDWSEKKTLWHWCAWLLIFIGSWMFGLVTLGCTLMGVSAVGASMKAGQWGATIGISVLSMVVAAVTVYLFLLPFKKFSRETEKEDRLEAENYEYELSHPKFSEIEKQIQKRVPALYQSLFAPGSKWDVCIYPLGVENDDEIYLIEGLVPANAKALRQTPHRPGDFLAFAFGDYEEFWLELGPEDPAVYTSDLESGELERISERLSVFLSWPKD